MTTLLLCGQLSFSKGEYLVSVFLDIKGAFDFVNVKLLAARLKYLGVPNKFCDFIYCLFQFKDLYIQHNDGYINRYSFTGVPQGCVLSPLCFNLYINEVFNGFPDDVHILAYADDIAIFSSDPDPYIARTRVQDALSNINRKLSELQLTLSTTKTKAMIFTRRRLDSLLVGPLTINGQQIAYVDTFNFLGFTFQKKLLLRAHVDNISHNCFHFINVLRSLCGVSWGSDCICLLRLYIGLIRPRIEYMAPLLLECKQTELLKLQRIQWKAIRIALGAMMSAHTLCMEQIANILPIPERLGMLSENLINKMLSNANHPSRTFLFQLALIPDGPVFVKKFAFKLQRNKIYTLNLHPMFSVPFEALILKPVVKFLPVKKNIDPSVVARYFKQFLGRWQGYERVYTDGSKTSTHVGCGIWFPNINIEAYFPLHPLSSIYAAEALAIVEALKLILVQNNKKFLIISDSKSVLTAISSFTNSRTHPLIFQIKSILHNLKTVGFIINFLWVPSHLGIEGNEYVDHVASTHIAALESEKIFVNDLKAADKSESLISWQKRRLYIRPFFV